MNFRTIFIFALLVCWGLMAQSETLNVCSNCKFQSITAAVGSSKPHDLINVEDGRYAESNIVINKPLTIEVSGKVIIDGSRAGHIFVIASDSVHLDGLHIANVGVSYTKDYAAIYAHRVKHFLIENCTIEEAFFGMLIEKSSNGVIRGNTVSGQGVSEVTSGNGIHLWHCQEVEIADNHLFGMRDGIYFEFVSKSNIHDNFSEKNFRYGLHFMFSNEDRYAKNVFQDNGAGVAVMFSKFIDMEDNQFLDNWGSASYGLLLKEIYDATIRNNYFDENTIAINVEGSTRIDYTNNTFHGNGWAVKIAGACYENSFSRNNFLANAFDVSYSGKLNDNTFHGNFWDSYSGYDLDKNGVGDIPHRPVKLFSYVVNRTPESIVLLRSLFVDLVNYSEKVSPVFTPTDLIDNKPLMRKVL